MEGLRGAVIFIVGVLLLIGLWEAGQALKKAGEVPRWCYKAGWLGALGVFGLPYLLLMGKLVPIDMPGMLVLVVFGVICLVCICASQIVIRIFCVWWLRREQSRGKAVAAAAGLLAFAALGLYLIVYFVMVPNASHGNPHNPEAPAYYEEL